MLCRGRRGGACKKRPPAPDAGERAAAVRSYWFGAQFRRRASHSSRSTVKGSTATLPTRISTMVDDPVTAMASPWATVSPYSTSRLRRQ